MGDEISDGVHVGLRSCRLHHMIRKMFSHWLIKLTRALRGQIVHWIFLFFGFFFGSLLLTQ